MESVIDLEEVAQEFKKWRSERTSKRDPIPDHLWRLVASLCANYTKSEICRRLGLAGNQLKHHLARVISPEENGFVLATTQTRDKEPAAPVIRNTTVKIIVTVTHRKLELRVDVDSVKSILPQLAGLL